MTQKYDITSNVLKRTDRNQIASVKAKKQHSKKILRFCGNYTTLYIHTSEWLKLRFLLQLLCHPVQRSRRVVSPPGSPLLYTVSFCFCLDYLIPGILFVIASCLFVCFFVFSPFLSFFLSLLFFGLCSLLPWFYFPLLSFSLLSLSTKGSTVTQRFPWIFSNPLK